MCLILGGPKRQQHFAQGFFPLPVGRGEGVAHGQETLHAHGGDEEDAAEHAGVDDKDHGLAGSLAEHPGEGQAVDPQWEGDEDEQVRHSQVENEDDGVRALLDVPQDGPDDQEVPRGPDQEGQTQDHTAHGCSTGYILDFHVF